MDHEMTDSGRQLEKQVAGVMQLLDDINIDLSRITGNPEAEKACRELSRRRAVLGETIGKLQGGQVRLEQRIQEHVSELARREAALGASRAELRALTRRLVQVQEDERRALARDLHDTSSQGMTVLGLGLAVLKRECGCAGGARDRIEDLQRAAATISEELHRLSANLRPAALDRYGLAPAVEELVTALREQQTIEVEFRGEGLEDRLPGDVETALYRIVQEACTNITRYAGASHALVTLQRAGGWVRVSVEDDGRGFDVAEALAHGGLGLIGMRERAEMLGGVIAIEASPGHGTRLRADVPAMGPSAAHRPAVSGEPRATERAFPVVLSEAAKLSHARTLSDALADIMAGMARLENEQELLQFVLARAAEAIGCDYALITAPAGRRWIVRHAHGLPLSMIGERLVQSAVPLALEVERTRGVVVVNDPRSGDPLSRAARETGVFSGVGIPLMVAGRFLGAAAFAHSSDPVPFMPGEVAFLSHLGSVISLVLEIIQLRASV